MLFFHSSSDSGTGPVLHLEYVLLKYLSCSEIHGYIEMGIKSNDLMGAPEDLLGCQSVASLVVFFQRSDTKGSLSRPRDVMIQKPRRGNESVRKDGGARIAITAHQGTFQRVTKLYCICEIYSLSFLCFASSDRAGVETFGLCALIKLPSPPAVCVNHRGEGQCKGTVPVYSSGWVFRGSSIVKMGTKSLKEAHCASLLTPLLWYSNKQEELNTAVS